MKKVHVQTIPAAEFERMKILARAAGVPIQTQSEVFRICYLADVFRGVYRLGKYRQERSLRPHPVDECPTISAASETTIRRGKEVAENRQR